MRRSKQELKHIIDQYDLDHAEQGGFREAVLKLAKEAGHEGVIAGEIINHLFPELPADERVALGDFLDRDLAGKGDGKWRRSVSIPRQSRGL